MDLERAVRAYINVRDKRAEIKKAFEAEDKKLREVQDRIGNAMLKVLNETKQTSAATGDGTVYKEVKLVPYGSDWNRFYDWIKENEAFDALQRRIKVGFISEYMEENDGELPPGVSVNREIEVRVRRK